MRTLVFVFVCVLSSCQCLEPVSEDAGAAPSLDAGIDAGPSCGVTIAGALVGTLPCPLVRWDDTSPDRFTFNIDALGASGRLTAIFGAPRTGHLVGVIDAPSELLGGSANLVPAGPTRPPFFFNVQGPPNPATEGIGGGSVDLQLSDASVTGTLDLRFVTDFPSTGVRETIQVKIVLPP